MTNTIANNTKSFSTTSDNSYDKTTMQTLNELIGAHYYKTRAVFDVEGKELVYVSDNIWGRVKLYLDGEQIFNGWSCLPGMFTDIVVNYEGVEYRVLSRIKNWLTYAQKITLIVNDSKAQSKIDPVLGGVRGLELLHALLTPVLMGLLVGGSLTFITGS